MTHVKRRVSAVAATWLWSPSLVDALYDIHNLCDTRLSDSAPRPIKLHNQRAHLLLRALQVTITLNYHDLLLLLNKKFIRFFQKL